MFSLLKGDCEHCGQSYRYSLTDAEFSDCTYAYCDTCGKLATISKSSSYLVKMPPSAGEQHVISADWEEFLRPCRCGGHFRHNAAPRCMVCLKPLSAEHAAEHIERGFLPGNRFWRWQRNWTDRYCMDIEDPALPGVPRQVSNPFLGSTPEPELRVPARQGWFSRLFSFGS